jgi:hypothetical protein
VRPVWVAASHAPIVATSTIAITTYRPFTAPPRGQER